MKINLQELRDNNESERIEYLHGVKKYNTTRSRFLRKNQQFFRQSKIFTKEDIAELISRNFWQKFRECNVFTKGIIEELI